MLKNKIVVITGGAGLIGQEFVKAVVKNNGIAIIADTNKKLAKKLVTRNIDFVKMDITSKKSIKNTIKYLKNKYGKIDALVNNAYPRNKNYGKHFFDVKYKDFCENTNLNLGGYFLTSQQFAKYFKKQGYGNIINISSIYGVVAPKFEIYEGTNMTVPVEYAIIKSAIIHFTKYLAKYLKGANIKVNTLSLGGILDNQPDSFVKAYKDKCLNKGMLNKSDPANSLVYLLSNMSKNLNGQNIIVDDGFSL